MKNEEIVLDATDSVLGRLATFAAKNALLGSKVIILNCDRAIILGNKKDLLEDHLAKARKGGVKGPFYPSKAHDIVKRAVRGMLDYKKGRGTEALKRVFCYKGLPPKYAESKKLNIEVKKTLKCIRVGDLEPR